MSQVNYYTAVSLPTSSLLHSPNFSSISFPLTYLYFQYVFTTILQWLYFALPSISLPPLTFLSFQSVPHSIFHCLYLVCYLPSFLTFPHLSSSFLYFFIYIFSFSFIYVLSSFYLFIFSSFLFPFFFLCFVLFFVYFPSFT